MFSLFRPLMIAVLLVLVQGVDVRGQQAANMVTVPVDLVAYPDLIIYNGKIVTMDDSSLNNSPGRIVQAMAVRGDSIQFLGSNQEVLRYAGPPTRKIDLQGRTATPGLIDTHNHLHNAAVSQWAENNPAKVETIARSFSVSGNSFEELTRGIELVVKEQMAHAQPGQWVMIGLPSGGTGTGIGVEYIHNKGMTRGQLDKLAPKLPVYINAHPQELWNTAARNDFLKFYAIKPTEDSDELITPTLIRRALISERYFSHHLSELANVIEDHLKHQVAGGFTTYSSHILGLTFMPAFRKLTVEGRMPMRLAFTHGACVEVEADIPGCFLRVGDWQGLGNKYFWNVGLSLVAIDSGPPSFCSTMEGPVEYKSQEQCRIEPGSPYYDAVYTALRSKYRYVINHNYGDKGLDHVMDIIEQVMKDNPDITLEFIHSLRISADHCGFSPRPAQLPRLKKLGFMLSCGAQYINRSAPWLHIYGEQYVNRIVPVKSILSAGIMPTAELSAFDLSEGEGPTPTAYLSWLITRRNARGESIAPAEAVDRVTVMKMATVWASYYVLKEKELGTLEPGKFADFVVWNKDYFTVSDNEFPTVLPVMTVLGGTVMSLREEFAKQLGVLPVGPQIKFQFKATYNFGEALEGPRGGE